MSSFFLFFCQNHRRAAPLFVCIFGRRLIRRVICDIIKENEVAFCGKSRGTLIKTIEWKNYEIVDKCIDEIYRWCDLSFLACVFTRRNDTIFWWMAVSFAFVYPDAHLGDRFIF